MDNPARLLGLRLTPNVANDLGLLRGVGLPDGGKALFRDDKTLEVTCDPPGYITVVHVRPPHPGIAALGLQTTWTRHEVVAAFGQPSKKGGATIDADFGAMGGWDRYDSDRYKLHIEYRPDGGGIAMVTLIDPLR